MSSYPELIEKYVLQDDLRSFDPYDIWKSVPGAWVKKKYYSNKAFSVLAAGLSVFDLFLNNRARWLYKRQEHPVVRAFAASILNKLYAEENKAAYLNYAKKNILWLLENTQKTGSGVGWGLGFYHPVSNTVAYPENAAFSTITPYMLEALIEDERIQGSYGAHKDVLQGVYRFFNEDIQVLEETDGYQVTSYGTQKDRKVVNAVSYTLYSILRLNDYFKQNATGSLNPEKLYNYVVSMQRPDGSWYYSEEGKPFIDCFHSCIVLKNLIKSVPYFPIDENVISKGYHYIKSNFKDPAKGLYRRFSLTNKPGLIKYDLYDQAEMLNIAVLMDDRAEADAILAAIRKNFITPSGIYSSIDLWGFRRNKNFLRWAVMPFLYSYTNYNLKYGRENN
ncbi:MAG TPA: prenyltransferase/squalene oxidase repeat-containing protein [Chitinophagaceae bacterium]|nr:prenyltransferase/squalene oxidase repeat-containing protein [Chitinophagaceae bacterium]